jgi:hypothetical protein
LAAVLVVAVILAAGAWMVLRGRSSEAVARIPPPPATAASSKTVATDLAEKYEAARTAPASPAAAESLCLACLADMFFDESDRCCALVIDRDPRQGAGAAIARLLSRNAAAASCFDNLPRAFRARGRFHVRPFHVHMLPCHDAFA